MLYKTRGLVLNFVKYRDASIIVKIFTEEFGLKTYIVNGVRSKRSRRNTIALYQPLTLLDLVIYNREGRDINRISEARLAYSHQSIIFHPTKISIAIFITEVLNKSLKEESANYPLFQFLVESIVTFDSLEQQFENFHLQLLLKMPSYLGFAILSAPAMLEQLQLEDLETPTILEFLEKLLHASFTEYIPAKGSERSRILELLILFYQKHLESFGEIRSLQILREII